MGVRRSVPAFYVIVLAVTFVVLGVSRPLLAAIGDSQPPSQFTSVTVLTISPNPAILGQTVTFTAHVSGVLGTGGVPTGTVTFQNGSTALGTATLDATGIGTFSTSSLAVGSYSVTAAYGGDANFLPSTSSPPVILNIVPQGSQNPSATGLKIVPDPAMLGQTITFTAHVGGATGIGGQVATGTVTFFEGTNQLGTASLDSSANASITDSSLPVGSYNVTAMYGGDAYFAPSTSPVVRLDVVPVGTLTPTTTTITSSAPSADFGTNITFTAKVTAGFGNPPTGTVVFNDGGTELGMGTLSNGLATFSTSSLSVGTHQITGVYSGDAVFAGSTSPPFTETINNSTSVMFILTVNPTSITVNQGNSGTATVTLTPSGGFNQQVTFLCSGLPIYAQCSFSPPTLTPDGSNTPSSVVMTVSTNVATAMLSRPKLHRGGVLLADMVGLFSVGMLGLVQIRGRRQRKPGRATRLGRATTWLLFSLAVLATLVLVSCGGSSSNGRVLTPKGMSTVTIAGSTSTGAQTTSFTFTVQ